MQLLQPKTFRVFLILSMLSYIVFTGCKQVESKGVMKDINTGMVTHWTKTSPESVVLVMNGEQLGHTDIPLGESFQLIAKNIQGLSNKNGKISVGCALTIADKSGKPLLNEADLFAGQSEFAVADDQFLRCTINTGAPMQWEENYDVTVRFWDKNSTGQIESKFSIHMIDVP
jgi:hypothetical protein